MAFSDTLLDLIAEKKITKSKMLSDLSLGGGTFATWQERGNTPNGEIVLKLARYFNVSCDYLLTGKESNIQAPNLTPSEMNFLQMYRKLDAVDKKYQYDALKLKYDDIKTFVDSSYPKYDECDDIKKSTQNAQ